MACFCHWRHALRLPCVDFLNPSRPGRQARDSRSLTTWRVTRSELTTISPAFSNVTVIRDPSTDYIWPTPHSGHAPWRTRTPGA